MTSLTCGGGTSSRSRSLQRFRRCWCTTLRAGSRRSYFRERSALGCRKWVSPAGTEHRSSILVSTTRRRADSRPNLLHLPLAPPHVHHQLDQHPRRGQRRRGHSSTYHRSVGRTQRPPIPAHLAPVAAHGAWRDWESPRREDPRVGCRRGRQETPFESVLYGAACRGLRRFLMAQLVRAPDNVAYNAGIPPALSPGTRSATLAEWPSPRLHCRVTFPRRSSSSSSLRSSTLFCPARSCLVWLNALDIGSRRESASMSHADVQL